LVPGEPEVDAAIVPEARVEQHPARRMACGWPAASPRLRNITMV
jgi:hypothetical protein